MHLLALRRQEAFEAAFDRLRDFVNDLEPPDVDADPFGQRSSPFFGHDVERDDDRPRRLGQRHVALVDAAHSFVNDRHAHFGMRELLHLAAKASIEPCESALMMRGRS